jgi:hypothetical protein
MKKLLPRVWLTLLVVLSTAALLAVTSGIWPGIPVRNNIMELLPALRDDPVLLQALQRSNSGVSRKLLILVGDTDTKKTAEAAMHRRKKPATAGFFRQAHDRHDNRASQRYRAVLLSVAHCVTERTTAQVIAGQ